MTDTPQLAEIAIISPELGLKTDDVSDRRARQAAAEILASDHNNTNGDETAGLSSQPQQSSVLEQDQGLLMDVLKELDRERQKRAELEARVRVLEQEVQFHRKKSTTKSNKSSKSSEASVRDYTIVKTERDGYKEILEAITQDRPAFSTYAPDDNIQKRRFGRRNKQQPPSLPIHIVRLLEVMPWDSRAQQYVFGEEHVYEWQFYSAGKKWQKELRYFPTFFKTLPIVVPSPGKIVSDDAATKKHRRFGSANIAPPKQCVLTDLEGKTILNIDKGYPLPEDGGGWAWVEAWKVEKNNDTDEDGWTYSNETSIMSDPSTYYGEFRVPEQGTPNIAKRRRKWSRSRVLTDYPYASQMTREYLKLITEKSIMDSNIVKLSGQLVDTKMNLTTLEAEKEQTDERIRTLERDLEDKNKILGLVEVGAGLQLTKATSAAADTSDASIKSTDSANKVDEIRSAVTQWVSNTVQKADGDNNTVVSNGSGEEAALITKLVQQQQQQLRLHDPKQQLFDSIRDKGTGLFEILKQKGEQLDKIKQGGGAGGVGLPWQKKEEDADTDSKETEDPESSTSSAASAPTKSNVYTPSARMRFLSSGSSKD